MVNFCWQVWGIVVSDAKATFHFALEAVSVEFFGSSPGISYCLIDNNESHYIIAHGSYAGINSFFLNASEFLQRQALATQYKMKGMSN